MTATRLVRLGDATVLTELLCRNCDFLAPWDPIRPAEFFTVDGQRAGIKAVLAEHEQGTRLPHVILTGDGQVAGRITLNEIVRGPFQSCRMGYWVAAEHNGRGLATGAVREITRVAFEELDCTGSRQARCCTRSDRSGCWNATGSSGSAWPRPISTSLAGGRTTSCTRW